VKKICSIIAIILVYALILVGCAGSASQTTPAQTTTEATTKSTETTVLQPQNYDADPFSLTIPAGWEAKEVEGGAHLYKRYPSMSGEVFDIYVRGTGYSAGDDKKEVETVAGSGNGTALEEITISGHDFWTTKYTKTAKARTLLCCVYNGALFTIEYGGPLYEENPIFQEILDSIVIK
jgi:hypothetical protein